MESSSFYGLNAAVLAESKSKISLSGCTITTTGAGANGVFAVGEESIVDLANVNIDCTASGAHGVDATLGGTLNLKNVNMITRGDGAAAAISTDRGGGTVNVTGGVVRTSGMRSPAIYSTGKISVTGAQLTATGSEGSVIEGKNSVFLKNCNLAGAKLWGAMLYQSFSGDAEIGIAVFKIDGGSLAAAKGPVFFCTNTTADIEVKGGAKLAAASGTLIKAGAFNWGTAGKNGADVSFSADGETLDGDIACDKISSIKVALKNGTALKGSINTKNKVARVALILDQTSVWDVTGDSILASLDVGGVDNISKRIIGNGHTVYYDAGVPANKWLDGKTFNLSGGGKLTPQS